MKSSFSWKHGQLVLAKQRTALNIRWSRDLPKSEPSSITISKDSAGRYFVSILMTEEILPLKASKNQVGIDLGITHSIVTSDGKKVDNPKFLKETEKK